MNGLNELILATIFGRRRAPFFVRDVNTNIRQHLPSPQASLFRAANACQVVWYERERVRVSLNVIRLAYVTEMH